MADIPSNLSYGTVTGRFLLAYADSNDVGSNPDAVPARGTVYFTPSPNYIKDASASPAPVTILPASIESSLDDEGYILGYTGDRGVRLIATDDPQGNPVDWTWDVEFRLTDADGNAVRTIPNFSFALPGGTTVDLTTAMPVTDPNGTYYLVGPTGPANSLSIGTVTTGSAGSSASATITGTAPSQTLSLTIPKGDTGATGATGATGSAATIAVGTTTTGAAGTSASVTNSGTSSAATFNFTIPRGNTGATGPSNVLSVGTVTTGAAGSSAAVTITGTSPSQTVNFTIPKGDKGDQGIQGIQGEQGPAGSLTNLVATAPIMYNSTTSTLSFDSTQLSSIDGGTA